MGTAQSSRIDHTAPHLGVSPSLALWAEDNDISPEDLAEAYGLGLGTNRNATTASATASPTPLPTLPTRPNEGLCPLAAAQLGKYVALDCEMVGVGERGRDSALARASLVDFHGRQVYDSLARPRVQVVDWRTVISGVSARDMHAARSFDDVRAAVADLLRGRILVGHGLHHDLAALELRHPRGMTRDTACFPAFKRYGNGPHPALRTLAKEILGIDIQKGAHSSIEDARVTMLLFRRHKAGFDADPAARFPQAAGSGQGEEKKAKKKNKKKKNGGK